MKIAVIGIGDVGLTLGKKWSQANHEVVFGARPQSLEKHRKMILSENIHAKVETIEGAAKGADVILLAVPHEEILNVAESLNNLLDGKTVIDVSNWALPDWSGLKLGFTTSGAEEVQKRLPRSHVVKAFNHYGANIMANPMFGDRKAVLYFCADHSKALHEVSKLVQDAGFDGVGINELKFARVLEPLAQLWIAGIEHFGADHAFAILKRAK
jgi:predicted dinucleotide-binding enzyme